MFSIAIYSDENDNVQELKSYIQDFLIERKIVAKLSLFSIYETLLTTPGSYDIYLMNMDYSDDAIELGKKMRDIDPGTYLIYMSENSAKAYESTKIHADYFIKAPVDKEELFSILNEIKQEIRQDNIIIQTPRGERRVRANNLNYINIEKRCLCYHLNDGAVFDGQTLRSSFEKAISPLQIHKSNSFLFLPPSLLINVGEIKILNSDNIVFENDNVLYFPKKSYDIIHNAWINYNRFINL